jgi:hypothetical protein
MKISPRALLCAAALTFASACHPEATVGTFGATIPTNAGQTCTAHCRTIGMNLSAVAIMANNVGCVCEARTQAANSGAGVAAGMATLRMQEDELDQQQQEAQRRQRRR